MLICTCPRFVVAGSQRPEEAHLVDPLPESLIANDVGYTSCIAVRREPLFAAGGFDERLGIAEDSDLWARLSLLGPFGYVACRTLVHRRAASSLSVSAHRSGEYMRSIMLSAERVLADVEQMRAARERGLLEPARAAVHFARALDAIARRDAAAARRELARACRLMPQLSSLPDLVFGRVMQTVTEDAEPLESFSAAAALWPDPGSDTALTLRAYAVSRAMRAGQLRRAGRLAAAGPLLFRPRLVRLILPAAVRQARRRVADRRTSSGAP